MNGTKKKFHALPKSKKVQFVLASVLTLTAMVAAPVLAWFANQREVATMAKINSPAKLTIKSGHSEDIIQFKMTGIDVGNEGKAGEAYFVFGVEGEDISYYNLQIAHTTNLPFYYTLYKSYEDDANGTVKYTDALSEDHMYVLAEEFVDDSSKAERGIYGGYINDSGNTDRLIADSNYTEKSYDSADYETYNDNTHIQYYAEPIYWQTKAAVNSTWVDTNGKQYNAYGANDPDNRFLNYYVLKVNWRAGAFPNGNDKETDLIYITAQVG